MAATHQPVRYGKQVRVRVHPDMKKEIDREMALDGVTATEVMRRAFRAYLSMPERKRRRFW